jgi:hypothetical protein
VGFGFGVKIESTTTYYIFIQFDAVSYSIKLVEFEAIFARRSIRKYTSDRVTDEDLTKML